mmetsp:Transcript_4485/g.11319  ORF Transcript_4485/g.11319 Transcript_4485/m.11319 type:complete len:233 (+) Transcript_4485:125-823(+)
MLVGLVGGPLDDASSDRLGGPLGGILLALLLQVGVPAHRPGHVLGRAHSRLHFANGVVCTGDGVHRAVLLLPLAPPRPLQPPPAPGGVLRVQPHLHLFEVSVQLRQKLSVADDNIVQQGVGADLVNQEAPPVERRARGALDDAPSDGALRALAEVVGADVLEVLVPRGVADGRGGRADGRLRAPHVLDALRDLVHGRPPPAVLENALKGPPPVSPVIEGNRGFRRHCRCRSH